jgi:hypothetical protein
LQAVAVYRVLAASGRTITVAYSTQCGPRLSNHLLLPRLRLEDATHAVLLAAPHGLWISVFRFDLGSLLLELAAQPIASGLHQAIITGSAYLRKLSEVALGQELSIVPAVVLARGAGRTRSSSSTLMRTAGTSWRPISSRSSQRGVPSERVEGSPRLAPRKADRGATSPLRAPRAPVAAPQNRSSRTPPLWGKAYLKILLSHDADLMKPSHAICSRVATQALSSWRTSTTNRLYCFRRRL